MPKEGRKSKGRQQAHMKSKGKLSSFIVLLGILSAIGFAGCQGSPNVQSPKATPGPSFLTQPHDYVAIGASTAVGRGATNPATDAYVPLIFHHLAQGSQLHNLGISGAGVDQALQDELPQALQAHPDLVTVWIGTDDLGRISLAAFQQGFDQILSQLAQTKAQIYVGNIPQLSYLPRFRNRSDAEKSQMLAKIQSWDTVIAQLVSKHGATLIDLYDQLDLKDYAAAWSSGDGFHPNNTGYQQIANFFWQAITSHNQ